VTECCDALNLPDIKAGLKVGDERICSPTACDNATICDFRTALQAFALEGVRIQDLATLEIEILDVDALVDDPIYTEVVRFEQPIPSARAMP
jgi:hypothetical protein